MTTLFISGIDTDIGKSIACGALANTLLSMGHKVFTQKWVETGVENDQSTDLATHRKLADKDFNTAPAEQHSPYLFKHPASPHLAAALQYHQIDCDYLIKQTQKLQAQCEHLLIEGAGGLCVPLTEDQLIADLLETMNLPVVLVTSGRLGSINHTLLSLAFCKQQNIEIRAVVFNQFGAGNNLINDDTQRFLKRQLAEKHPNALWLDLPLNANQIMLSSTQTSDLLRR